MKLFWHTEAVPLWDVLLEEAVLRVSCKFSRAYPCVGVISRQFCEDDTSAWLFSYGLASCLQSIFLENTSGGLPLNTLRIFEDFLIIFCIFVIKYIFEVSDFFVWYFERFLLWKEREIFLINKCIFVYHKLYYFLLY